MGKTIYVNCSFCEGLMEIEIETGKTINKWAPGEKDSTGDKMTTALQKLEDAKKRRADLFNVKKEEMEAQKKKVEDTFKKQVEKAKKEGVTENPIRPFDLD